ncbi:uncharacterized protein NPIL_606671, partial [Nephila pilipes]
MEGKSEEIGPDMLDGILDDLYYNNDRHEKEKRRKRSSILKRARSSNPDIYEFEDIEFKRKSQSSKRVSFADTFQVKELVTGNIYDIPGRHELEASKESHTSVQESCFIEAEKENIPIVSRSSSKYKTENAQDLENKYLCPFKLVMPENVKRKPLMFVPNLEKNEIEPSFQLSDKAYSHLQNSGVGNEMELTIIHNQENLNISSGDPENFFENPKPKSYTVETHHIVSSTISCVSSSHDLSKASPSVKDFDKDIYSFLDSDRKKNFLKEQFCTSSQNNSASSALNSFSFNNEILEEKALLFPAYSKNETKFANDFYFDKSADYLLQNKENIHHFVFPPFPQGINYKSLHHNRPVSDNLAAAQPSENQIDKTKLAFEEMEITFLNPQAHSSVIEKHCEETGNKTKFTVHDMEETCADSLEASLLCEQPDAVFFDDDAMEPNSGNSNNYEDLERPTENVNSHNQLEILAVNNEIINKTRFNLAEIYDKNDYHISEKEKFTNIFTDKENGQDKITNFTSEKISVSKCSTDFIEGKENIKFDRKGKIETFTSNLICNETEYIPDAEDFRIKDDGELEIERNTLDFNALLAKPFHVDKSDKLPHINKNSMFQSSAMDITCNTEFFEENNGDSDFQEKLKLKDIPEIVENSHSDQQSSVEKLKTQYFESDMMESTCGFRNNILQSLNDSSSEIDQQVEMLRNKNSEFTESCKTHTLTSDKMELTCVGNYSLQADEVSDLEICQQVQSKKLPNENHKFSENSETHHFTSDKMELTCAHVNNMLHSINDSGSDTHPKTGFLNCDSSKNLRLAKNSGTHNFTNDGMELTCAYINNSFQSINDSGLDTTPQTGSLKNGISSKNIRLGENSRTHNFTNDGMELTCAHVNNMLQIINNSGSDTHPQIGSLENQNSNKNLRLSENCRTHNFTNDGMELTCAINNDTEFRTICDANVKLYDASYRIEENSPFVSENHCEETETRHSLNVEKDNLILNSVGYEKSCKEHQFFKSYSPEILPNSNEQDCNSSNNINKLFSETGKSLNKTFNSHEKEFTFAVNRSHEAQGSPFFQLNGTCTSKSNISKKQSFNLENSCGNSKKKSFQISYSQVSLQSCSSTMNAINTVESTTDKTKLLDSKTNNPGDKVLNNSPISTELKNIACNEEINKVALQKKSISHKNVDDAFLTPLDLNDANSKLVKVEQKNQYSNAATPGAVYTLRKKRQQLSGSVVNKLILSPEVTYIMKKAEKLNLKRPFSEVKSNSPIRYDCKKSLDFNSFEMENSFKIENKQNVLSSNSQSLNKSPKATGDIGILPVNSPPNNIFTNFTGKEESLNSQKEKETHSDSKYNQDILSIALKEKAETSLVSFNDSLQILPNLIHESSKFSMSETMSKIYSSKLFNDITSRKETIMVNPIETNMLPETSNLNLNSIEGNKCSDNLPNSLSCSVFCDETKQKESVSENNTSKSVYKTIENDCVSPKVEETSVFLDTFKQNKNTSINCNDNVMLSGKSYLKIITSNSDLSDSSKSVNLNISSMNLSIADTSKKVSLKRKIPIMAEENSYVCLEKRSTDVTLKETSNLLEISCAHKSNGMIDVIRAAVKDATLILSENQKKMEVPISHEVNDVVSPEKSVETAHSSLSENLLKILESNNKNELMHQNSKDQINKSPEKEISHFNDPVSLRSVGAENSRLSENLSKIIDSNIQSELRDQDSKDPTKSSEIE